MTTPAGRETGNRFSISSLGAVRLGKGKSIGCLDLSQEDTLEVASGGHRVVQVSCSRSGLILNPKFARQDLLDRSTCGSGSLR